MKILHVVADYSPASEGVRKVIETLTHGQSERGYCVKILCTGSASLPPPNVEIYSYPRKFFKRAYFSPGLMHEIRTLVDGVDLVHIHSNWTFPVWWAAWRARRAGVPYVHSSHGCLDPIKLHHSRRRKRLVAPLDRWVLRNASGLQVASELESSWVVAWEPECEERIRVIPHSVNLPSVQRNFDSPGSTDRPRRFLSIGRLHPLKGLDLWLKALSTVEGSWECVIAGPDEQQTLRQLQEICQKKKLTDRIRFLPFVDEEEKVQLMKEADVFVLPSRTENFGLVAGEAMAFGLPVLVTSVTPWGAHFQLCDKAQQPGWVATPDAHSLSHVAQTILQVSPNDLASKGKLAQNWIADHHNLETMLEDYGNLYTEVCKFRRS